MNDQFLVQNLQAHIKNLAKIETQILSLFKVIMDNKSIPPNLKLDKIVGVISSDLNQSKLSIANLIESLYEKNNLESLLQ